MTLPFLHTPVLVLGKDLLAEQVVLGLRRDGHRARRIDRRELAALDLSRVSVLILADPEEGPALVAELIPRGREADRHRHSGGPWPGRRLIFMHSRDPAPALPLPAPDDHLRVETFAIEDRAARTLLRRWPPHLGVDPGFGQVPHLLILGFAPPARSLLLQALRLAHYGQGRPWISLVCDRHETVAAEFLAAYPQAPLIAVLRFAPLAALTSLLQPEDAHDLNSRPPAIPPVSLALVCIDSPAVDNIGTPALTLPPTHQTSPPGLACCVTDNVGSASLALARRLTVELAARQGVSPPVLLEVGDTEPGGDIDDWDGQIIPIAYRREACSAALLLDGAGDELARTIHEHYCDTIAAQGRDLTQEPAGQPWERLATSYRQANRHQADHVWAKLAVTDCRAVPEDLVEAFALSPLEVERLAMVEHERWAADRYLDGWSYAPVRDNARKLHPQLIPYADLSEPMKDLDRFAVRGLPTLAARLGLGIQRLLILGVHPPGPACPTAKPLRRLALALEECLRERYPDRALVIASTLADARERDLARVLMEAAGLFLLLPRPLSQILAGLTPPAARRDFLDLLTRAERRISLRGEAELATWFARRAEIHLVLDHRVPASFAETSATAQAGARMEGFFAPRATASDAGSAFDSGHAVDMSGPTPAPETGTHGEAIDKGSTEVSGRNNLMGMPNKCILLNPDGAGLTWTFDY